MSGTADCKQINVCIQHLKMWFFFNFQGFLDLCPQSGGSCASPPCPRLNRRRGKVGNYGSQAGPVGLDWRRGGARPESGPAGHEAEKEGGGEAKVRWHFPTCYFSPLSTMCVSNMREEIWWWERCHLPAAGLDEVLELLFFFLKWRAESKQDVSPLHNWSFILFFFYIKSSFANDKGWSINGNV